MNIYSEYDFEEYSEYQPDELDMIAWQGKWYEPDSYKDDSYKDCHLDICSRCSKTNPGSKICHVCYPE